MNRPTIAQHIQMTNELAAANNKIMELEKKLKDSESLKEMYRNNAASSEATIEQIMQFLDAVPNSVPRESNHEESWRCVTLTPVIRLAAWLVRIRDGLL